ncbi:MAG TPA: TIGR01777 family oxidoreductase [Pirellulales bacterium]|nr:TIGR01777 family oxidoreductase [Pirellulales bacterium]
MRALVTGATGFVGRHLLAHISEPVVLTRRPDRFQSPQPAVEVHGWDPQTERPPAAAFRGVEAVFHLAGEPVAEGRWTAAKKERIRESRRLSTANLVQGLREAAERPPVLVSASAVGIYGDRGDETLDEASMPADDFLAEVCRQWEEASAAAREVGLRVVNPRIGIVLGRDGGALAKMLTPFKLGVGGRLASGRQWMPWVHIDDLVGLLLHAARTSDLNGPMNAVGPRPVTNRDFTEALARTLHRPAVFPMPGAMLKLAFGQFAEVLLASQRVLPKAAQESGYCFQFSELSAALVNLLHAR